MGQRLRDLWRRRHRWPTHTHVSYLIYRYRYLYTFAAIGLLAVTLEVALAHYLMPGAWPWLLKAVLAFAFGLLVSFALNATVNFRVSPGHRRDAFVRFTLVSGLSFALNMVAVHGYQEYFERGYPAARLLSAGALFLIAYALHRRYTFDRTHDFGIAVYASRAERVYRIFHKIGRNCDHVHVDLVDETMNPRCDPVDLGRLRLVRRLWPGVPVCLHVMSLEPARWAEQAWDHVDWLLFHAPARDDLYRLIVQGRMRKKKVGVVWHQSAPLEAVLPYLPHVDFVMVLGIAEPGRSGQPVSEEALRVTELLDDLRPRYGYEVMFDGGVNAATVGRIRAKYVVAASAVLRAANPVRSIHTLRTNAKYEYERRRVA